MTEWVDAPQGWTMTIAEAVESQLSESCEPRSRICYVESAELQGSILGEVLDNYIDGDVFIAPLGVKGATGTILDGVIKVVPK